MQTQEQRLRRTAFVGTPRKAAALGQIRVTFPPFPQPSTGDDAGRRGGLVRMKPRASWTDTATSGYHTTLGIAGEATKESVCSLGAPVSPL